MCYGYFIGQFSVTLRENNENLTIPEGLKFDLKSISYTTAYTTYSTYSEMFLSAKIRKLIKSILYVSVHPFSKYIFFTQTYRDILQLKITKTRACISKITEKCSKNEPYMRYLCHRGPTIIPLSRTRFVSRFCMTTENATIDITNK